jgi:hypothetical protein
MQTDVDVTIANARDSHTYISYTTPRLERAGCFHLNIDYTDSKKITQNSGIDVTMLGRNSNVGTRNGEGIDLYSLLHVI